MSVCDEIAIENRRKPVARATNLALEEEFFAVEGRPQPGGNRACAYVAALERAPNGDRISPAERAALWYLAYWAMDDVTRPSIAALAMHIDTFVSDAWQVLLRLVYNGILTPVPKDLAVIAPDVRVFRFVELGTT
jgi:hypothetical protein